MKAKENLQQDTNNADALSYFLDGILEHFSSTNNEPAFQMLDKSDRWKELQEFEDIYFRLLRQHYGQNDVIRNLSDIESEMQSMYGNACYLAGVREGFSFALWSAGIQNNEEAIR